MRAPGSDSHLDSSSVSGMTYAPILSVAEREKGSEQARDADHCEVGRSGGEPEYPGDATEDRCPAEQFNGETAADDTTEPDVRQ